MFTITRRQAARRERRLSDQPPGTRRFASAAAGDTLEHRLQRQPAVLRSDDGASAVNPTIQSIYRSVFDHYIGQKPDLAFKPGLLTAWGWNEDKTKVLDGCREDVIWHDGCRLRRRMSSGRSSAPATKDSGNPIQFIWATIGNFKIDGNRVTADVKSFEPTLSNGWRFSPAMCCPRPITRRSAPKASRKSRSARAPIWSTNTRATLSCASRPIPKYWGEKPAFDTVVFKFVPDATTRVAEIECGASDFTLEVPYEEFDRLKKKAPRRRRTPISDIGMIFITNDEPMLDKNVRLAAIMPIDKKAIVDRLLHGYGVPIDTLEAPEYAAFDPSIKVPYDPELATKLLAASGYSPDKPVKFTIQTTRGFKPKDYEMIQAIVGMWRNVGIDANIEVYEIAKHFELRTTPQARAGGLLQLGQLYRRSDDLDRLCDVRRRRRTRLGSPTISTPRSPRSGARRTRQSASRAGRMRTAISPSKAMCCRCCNMRSRLSTSPISRSRTIRPAHCCRRV